MSTTFYPLLLSVGAMLCWGVLYIFTTKLTRSVGSYMTLILFQSVSILLLLILLPFVHQPINIRGIGSFITVGLWSGLMWLLFLHATNIGNVAIVLPVSNLSIPFIAFLGVFFLHESFSPAKAISVCFVFVGVILLGLDFKAIKNLKKQVLFKGVAPAIAAGFGVSIYVFINTYLVRWYGWYNSSFFIRVGIVAVVAIVMLLKHKKISLKKIPWIIVIGAALVDTVGFILYNIALTGSELSYVSVITNSSMLITVILAAWLLKERLNKIQWFGFVCTMAGIVLLQLG